MDNENIRNYCTDLSAYVDASPEQIEDMIRTVCDMGFGSDKVVNMGKLFLTHNYRAALKGCLSQGYCDLVIAQSFKRKNSFDIGVFWSRNGMVKAYYSQSFLNLSFDPGALKEVYRQFLLLLDAITVTNNGGAISLGKEAKLLRRAHFHRVYRQLCYEIGKKPIDQSIILPELKEMASTYGPTDGLLPKQ